MSDSNIKKTTQLRRLIEEPGLLVMPGAFDPFSAMIIERAGFSAVQCSGLAMTATELGLPDYSFLGMSDMVQLTGKIAAATTLPVMADGDTGFGNAVNAWYAVQAFERAGAAGVNIEDQVMPKRCGHLDGKSVISLEEGVAKIRAASEARHDKDFVINARTDALAVYGVEDVIRRGNAYLEAGATMIFVDGASDIETIGTLVKKIGGPVAVNLVPGGKSPKDLDLPALEKLGVARVSLPGIAFSSATKAMSETLALVKETGLVASVADRMFGFHEGHRLLGMDTVNALEEKYLAPLRNGPVGEGR